MGTVKAVVISPKAQATGVSEWLGHTGIKLILCIYSYCCNGKHCGGGLSLYLNEVLRKLEAEGCAHTCSWTVGLV